MEKQQRYITCPKCRERVRVRDLSHFRGHGIRISRWKCPCCECEVPSDRGHDLKDHVRRRHQGVDPETIVPIWGNLEGREEGLGGATRPRGRPQQREATVSRPPAEEATSTQERVTPGRVPRASSQDARPVAVSGVRATTPPSTSDVDISLREDCSFLTSSSVSAVATPTRLPRSIVTRVKVLSPVAERQSVRERVKGESRSRKDSSKASPPVTKRQRSASTRKTERPQQPARSVSAEPQVQPTVITRDQVVDFLSTIEKEEWQQIRARVNRRRQDEGEREPEVGVQTRNLERAGVTPRRPEVTSAAVQTSHQAANVTHTTDGLVVMFPCGSTLSVHNPQWLPDPSAPEDSE